MKKVFISILKMIMAIFIVFIMPFILPILLKILLNLKIFGNINEFKEIIGLFGNTYILIYILIGIVILLWFFYNFDGVKKIVKNMNIAFTFGDKNYLLNI